MSQNSYSHEQGNHQEGESIFKRAEVIIIDDRLGQENSNDSLFEETRSDHTTQEGSSSLSLRYTCFLGLVFCSIFGFGMVLLSLVMTVISIFTFFQNQEINANTKQFWSFVGNTAVAGFGFTLGLLAPRFGLSLVLVYFSMADSQSLDGDILSKIFRQSTKGFGKEG